MADYKETHIIKSDSGEKSSATPWLTLIIGILLVALVGVFLLNAHGSVSTPGGSISLGIHSPVAAPVTR